MSAIQSSPTFLMWDPATQVQVNMDFEAMRPEIGNTPAMWVEIDTTKPSNLLTTITSRSYVNDAGTCHTKVKCIVPFLALDGVTVKKSEFKAEYIVPDGTVDDRQLIYHAKNALGLANVASSVVSRQPTW